MLSFDLTSTYRKPNDESNMSAASRHRFCAYLRFWLVGFLPLCLLATEAQASSWFRQLTSLRFWNEQTYSMQAGVLDLSQMAEDGGYRVEGEVVFVPGVELEPRYMNDQEWLDLVRQHPLRTIRAEFAPKLRPEPVTSGTFVIRLSNPKQRPLAFTFQTSFHYFKIYQSWPDGSKHTLDPGRPSPTYALQPPLSLIDAHPKHLGSATDSILYLYARSALVDGQSSINLPYMFFGDSDQIERLTVKIRYTFITLGGIALAVFLFYLLMFLMHQGARSSLYLAFFALSFTLMNFIGTFGDIPFFRAIRLFTHCNLAASLFLILFLFESFGRFQQSRTNLRWKMISALIFVPYFILAEFYWVPGILFTLLLVYCAAITIWMLVVAMRKNIPGSYALLIGALGNLIFQGDLVIMHMKQDISEQLNQIFLAHISLILGLCVVNAQQFAVTFKKAIAHDRLNQALLDAIKEQEKTRTHFFQNTSHELRTPLNGIIGFINLIQQHRYGLIPEAAQIQLQKVRRLADSLLLQVNTILDIAKSNQGQLKIEPCVFTLNDLKEDADHLAEGLALKAPDLSYHSSFEATDPRFITDYDKVFTIVRNLLGNAFKFREPNRPHHVELSLKADSTILSLTVRDTGIGIAEDQQQRIFEEFAQVERGAARSFEGTGLGLAMVKDLVTLLGGRIELESKLGKGSCFRIMIPRLSVDSIEGHIQERAVKGKVSDQSELILPLGQGQIEESQDHAGQVWHLLIVDDHPHNAELIAAILSPCGYRLSLAYSGEEALVCLKQDPPHLVLLDLMMPRTSGEDVLRFIRNDPELMAIPVILVTARASDEDKLHGLKLGADDYLSKPIHAPELLLRVGNQIQQLRLHRHALAASEASRLEQVRLNAVKSQFLANTSHELRTPIHGLQGMAEGLLQSNTIEAQDRETLLAMLDASRRLARLVDTILDFGETEQGALQLKLEDFNILPLIEEALHSIDRRDRHAGVAWKVENRDVLWVKGDRERTLQVLTALLSNAFRFTREGHVLVSFGETDQRVVLRIQDTGQGISPEQIARSREAFEQGDGSVTRAKGGTGLGLALAYRLMEAQGGELHLTSTLKVGTEVTLVLPAGEAKVIAMPALRTQTNQEHVRLNVNRELRREPTMKVAVGTHYSEPISTAIQPRTDRLPRILVVDDEELNQRVVDRYLRDEEYELVFADSGRQALEQFAQDGPYDAVLLDVMMPEMSGYQVAQILRRQYGAHELPIIMITAKQQVSDLVEGFETGASDYIHKPYSKAELIARLNAHLHLARTSRAMRRFVPTEMLQLIGCEHIAELSLGMARAHAITIAFTDIRGFSTSLELMQPQAAFEWLNRCYQLIGPEVRKGGGFIDKYIGDGIMALFPESADHALNATLAMHHSTRKLKDLQLGTGLHFGQTILGTLGESERFDATVLSDAVNVASRIEGACRQLDAALLVSDEFRRTLSQIASWQWRCIGPVRLKGRQTAVELWEVLDAKTPEQLRILAPREAYEALLKAALECAWPSAYDQAHVLSKAYPHDRVIKLYEETLCIRLESKSGEPWMLELRDKT